MGTEEGTAALVAWSQTCLDGAPARARADLVEGMTWSWRGQALRVPWARECSMPLTAPRHPQLRAARIVRTFLDEAGFEPGRVASSGIRPSVTAAGEDAETRLVLSDGNRFFCAVIAEVESGEPPVLFFPDGLPRARQSCTVVSCPSALVRSGASDQSTICFTPGTPIATDGGLRTVERLAPGDRVLTRDSGFQEVLWIGRRRMSGARLFTAPGARPVRIRAGALGENRPATDLVVSPGHRVLIGGPAVRALWPEGEVLVRAADLVGLPGIGVDPLLRETTYVHLLLSRHEIVRSANLDTETLHPGLTDPSFLTAELRAAFARTGSGCRRTDDDPVARRMLTRGEAAILLDGPAACPRAA